MDVTSGFLPIEPELEEMTGTTLLTESQGAGPSTAQRSVADVLMCKCGEAAIGQAPMPALKKQKKQTYQKCFKTGCPGSGGCAKCKSVCQDCKLPECSGQEEKKPNTPCVNYCQGKIAKK
jgi:hypothetical protein